MEEMCLCILIPFVYGLGLKKNCHTDLSYLTSSLALQTGCLCLSEKFTNSRKIKNSDLNYFLNFIINSSPVVLSSALCMFVFHQEAQVFIQFAILCNLLQWYLMKYMRLNFKQSFSNGEISIAGQCIALTLSMSLYHVFVSHSNEENNNAALFIHSAVLLAVLMFSFMLKFKGRINLISFFVILFLCGVCGVLMSSLLMRRSSILWLLHMFLSPTRLALIGWWTNVSVLIVLFAASTPKSINKMPKTVLRKVFHLLIVLLLTPGIALDPALTWFTTASVLILLLLLEVIRFCDIEPISSALTSIFTNFLDNKDRGPLILSHIYLLIAVACPLWLYPCNFEDDLRLKMLSKGFALGQEVTLPLFAGVISVGVGDAAASVGGTFFGKHKIRNGDKTIEGSICSIICQGAFLGLLVYSGVVKFVTIWCVMKSASAIVVTTAVEAFTSQVDNIVLPLVMYSMLMT